jgi:hypothetical protein
MTFADVRAAGAQVIQAGGAVPEDGWVELGAEEIRAIREEAEEGAKWARGADEHRINLEVVGLATEALEAAERGGRVFHVTSGGWECFAVAEKVLATDGH